MSLVKLYPKKNPHMHLHDISMISQDFPQDGQNCNYQFSPSPLYPHYIPTKIFLKMAKWFQQHLQVSRHRGVHVDQDLARRGCLLHQRGHRVHLGYVRDDGKLEFPGVHMMEHVRDDGKYMISRCTYWIYIWIWILLNKICAVSEYISPYVHIIIYILWYPLVLQHGS